MKAKTEIERVDLLVNSFVLVDDKSKPLHIHFCYAYLRTDKNKKQTSGIRPISIFFQKSRTNDKELAF